MAKPKTKMTREELDRRAARVALRRQEKIDAYLAEHGAPPLCGCGCGGRVSFSYRHHGKPNQYIQHHHPRNDLSQARAVYQAPEELVPIEDFRAAVQRLRRERGWTLAETAEKGGVGLGHFKHLMYARRQKAVRKDWARGFFTRLAGQPTTMSTYQRRVLTRAAQRDDMIEREMDREVEREHARAG